MLPLGQVYTVTLKGGVGEPHITNAAGTPLVADYTWSFFATAALIIASTEVPMLSDWDAAGVSYVAMRPDKLLAPFLGINGESSVPSDAYLLVDTTRKPGAGIVSVRLP
jgi:hypothetical protein